MKKELLFLTGIALSGLGLGACSESSGLDIADVLKMQCKANPQAVLAQRLELATKQEIQLDGHSISIAAPGRLHFYRDAEIEGTKITSVNALSIDRFGVQARGIEDKTEVIITYNCADPKNP